MAKIVLKDTRALDITTNVASAVASGKPKIVLSTLENNLLEQRLEEKLIYVNSFNNSINSIEEMVT